MDDDTGAGGLTVLRHEVELQGLGDVLIGELVHHRATDDEERQRGEQRDGRERALQTERRHWCLNEKKLFAGSLVLLIECIHNVCDVLGVLLERLLERFFGLGIDGSHDLGCRLLKLHATGGQPGHPTLFHGPEFLDKWGVVDFLNKLLHT